MDEDNPPKVDEKETEQIQVEESKIDVIVVLDDMSIDEWRLPYISYLKEGTLPDDQK